MATREALAIRREAAFARIAAAVGSDPPAATRDPDLTLTQFVEWTADTVESLTAPKAKATKAKAKDADEQAAE